MSSEPPVINQTFFDAAKRYRIVGTLGAGNFGVVYKAYDEKWGEHVALKTSRDGSVEQQQWLKEEYRIQSDIVHPIFVQPDELREEHGRFFFTMKLVDDALPFTDYFRAWRETHSDESDKFVSAVCMAALELADGLQIIHSFGRFHGDIKPANVLITGKGEVALLDFGLMRSTNDPHAHHSSGGELVGTPTYLPPEQYQTSNLNAVGDWYALGLMLYEALTEKEAFQGDALEVLIAKQMAAPEMDATVVDVPPALRSLVESMLDPDPNRRPSGSEVSGVLSDCVAFGEASSASPVWLSNQAHPDDAFVARDEELGTLTQAYAAACQGTSKLVEIVGPSGIGKTALVRRFLAGVSPASTLVIEGRCLPSEAIPYKAFDAVIDELINYWLNLPKDAAKNLLPAEDAAALALLFPELRRVSVFEQQAGESISAGDPRTQRLAGFKALATVFRNIAAEKSLVVYIDDVQWADSDSAALFENVFREIADSPVLFIFARRPDDEIGENELLTQVNNLAPERSHRIDLSPMDPDDCRQLVASILKERGTAADVVDHIVSQAAGLPYLLSELSHFANIQGERFSTAPRLETGESLLTERLDTLALENTVLVELAAVASVPLAPEVLLSAAESTQRYRIRDLCGLRLLKSIARDNRQALQIYHDHLREFVLANMSAENASKRHASLLASMETQGGYEHEAMLPHAEASNNIERIRHHARGAANRAKASLAFKQAAHFLNIILGTYAESERSLELMVEYADALANAGQSTQAAPTYEKAYLQLSAQDKHATEQQGELQRKAGEQYLKSGHFNEGLKILNDFLSERGVKLPRSGRSALVVSSLRRGRLYARGFKFDSEATASDADQVSGRLDYLWAATTSLSMMDPVRADAIGLLHFLESLKAGNKPHIARSLGYEAAFAALIGGDYLRGKANQMLALNLQLLDNTSSAYEHAFYHLGLGAAAFFNSDWQATVKHCDIATEKFRKECLGAEYEASVSVVFALQALGMAGDIQALEQRLPTAIQDADERGDLFAANNCRGGYHAIGRIATGQIDLVEAELQKVVETWTPGFYQMHAYHRVFAAVNADLYQGNPHSALAKIDDDWAELKRGLFLTMELPALELRWARARACLAVAAVSPPKKARKLIARTRKIQRLIRKATVAAAAPHADLIDAGLAALRQDQVALSAFLRSALHGYTRAGMVVHSEVARWLLLEHTADEEFTLMKAQSEHWQKENRIPEMQPLVDTLAPTCRRSNLQT